MSSLKAMIPINFLEEKARFLADPRYNPQFTYAKPIATKKLDIYGQPQKRYLELAQEIVDRTYAHRNDQDLQMLKGDVVSQDEASQTINTFLKIYDLDKRFSVVWSRSFLVRATITPHTLKLRLPCTYRTQSLMGMLYHEVGTHALRRLNYEQQPWHKRKKKYDFSEYLPTEEGLASLHRLIPYSFKSAHEIALRYLTVDYAQQHSFAEVVAFLQKYASSPLRAWAIAFREKRGLEDTSQPGGFTKDMVYFEGFVKVWQWLKQHDFDVTKLYWGKLDTADVEKAVSLNPDFQPVLPKFFTNDRAKYAQTLTEIGEWNQLHTLSPHD